MMRFLTFLLVTSAVLYADNQKLVCAIEALENGESDEEVLTLVEEIIRDCLPRERQKAELVVQIAAAQKEMEKRILSRNEKRIPVLSFIIPCHNREKTLRDAIESIYQQNLSFPFEVIAVDDSSTDNSFKMLLEYEQKYDNFFAFRNSVNLKAPATRNIAIGYARAPYICNADSDDVFAKESLEPMLQGMVAGGYDVALFQTLKYFRDQYCDGVPVIPAHTLPPGNEILLMPYLRDQYLSPCAGNRIMKKQSWLDAGGYLEKPGHDSWAFSYRLLASGSRMYVHPSSFYYHRLWSDNSSMYGVDNNNNVHDISPLAVVLESPELISQKSYIFLQKYQPSGNKFIEFIKNNLSKRGINFVQEYEQILSAYRHENRGEFQAALDGYIEIIQRSRTAHFHVYLRAIRLALRLHERSLAVDLIRKITNDVFFLR